MTVFKYAMLRGFMQPVSLIANTIVPIMLFIFSNENSFGMNNEARGYFMMALLILFGAFMMAGGIQRDKIDGVTLRILAGPLTFRSYLVQNFFAGLMPMTVLIFILGVLGIILHGWNVIFTVWVSLTYILLSATSIGLSFVWSLWFKDKESGVVTFSFSLTLMAFMGGIMLPFSILPPVIRNIGALFPVHWAARAFEALLAEGANLEYAFSLFILLLFTVVLILYGSKRRII